MPAATGAPTAAAQPKATSSSHPTAHVAGNTQAANLPDLVCLSHLRWDFVYQRPQHLLSRFARHTRVFFVEEPHFDGPETSWLDVSPRDGGVQLVVAHLPHGLSPAQIEAEQRRLLDGFFAEQDLKHYIFWYYTPMSLGFTDHFSPLLTVYDCMDELSAFKFAPERLKELEQQLFQKADLVFTGGQSLYEAKQHQHPRVYAFPSSIDKAHFGQARRPLPQPADQAAIAEPRIGFFGVLDERADLDLLAAVADARPDWQLILIGPVVKIDPADLPRRPNLHYLGGKPYTELPAYLSSWQVAMLPFALNESTRFISPTKTPEYLAAGKPVVSTPIRDVVRPYGEQQLVHIAGSPEEFCAAIEQALLQHQDEEWQARVDAFLSQISWDQTWQGMLSLMQDVLQQQKKA
ncbi:glycosyltransferase family 1 protein [Cesiribacter andamanensis]|nr:glycosyltransferase family 1 protein [Cesiribacter andamanensis]